MALDAQDVVAAAKRAGFRIERHDAHGIVIAGLRKTLPIEYASEVRWRFYCGSGIAGNGHVYWMRQFVPGATEKPRGPFKTRREIGRALRVLRMELGR